MNQNNSHANKTGVWRRLLSIMLAVCMVISMTPAVMAEDITAEPAPEETVPETTPEKTVPELSVQPLEAVTGDTVISKDREISVSETLTVEAGATLTIDNDVTLTVQGKIEIKENGKLINNGRIKVCGNEITNHGAITNGGRLETISFGKIYNYQNITNVDGGQLINDNSFVYNYGTITNENGGQLIISNFQNFKNNGTITNNDGTMAIGIGASVNGTGTITGTGTFTTQSLTADMITVPTDLVYESGKDFTRDIIARTTVADTAVICGQVFTFVSEGWPDEPTVTKESELEYTVTYANSTYPNSPYAKASKTVTLLQSGAKITAAVYKGDAEATEFYSGETVTVKATVTATGEVPATMANSRLRGEPTSGQMALYYISEYKNVQLSDAVSANENGEYIMTASVDDILETIGMRQGSATLTVKFVGNDTMADAQTTVNVTLHEVTTVIPAVIVKDKIYDGSTDAHVDITFTDLDGHQVPLTNTSDYSITSANFVSPDIGQNKDVTITIEMLNPEYRLTETTFTATGNIICGHSDDNCDKICDICQAEATIEVTDGTTSTFLFGDVTAQLLNEAMGKAGELSSYYNPYIPVTVKLKQGNYDITDCELSVNYGNIVFSALDSKLNIKKVTVCTDALNRGNEITFEANNTYIEQVEVRGSTTFTLNGSTIQGTVYVEGNGEFIVNSGFVKGSIATDTTDSRAIITVAGGTVANLNAKSDTTLNVSGGTITNLTFDEFSNNANINITGGKFGTIVTPANVPVSSLLKDGYGFYHTDGNTPATAEELATNTIKNVFVAKENARIIERFNYYTDKDNPEFSDPSGPCYWNGDSNTLTLTDCTITNNVILPDNVSVTIKLEGESSIDGGILVSPESDVNPAICDLRISGNGTLNIGGGIRFSSKYRHNNLIIEEGATVNSNGEIKFNSSSGDGGNVAVDGNLTVASGYYCDAITAHTLSIGENGILDVSGKGGVRLNVDSNAPGFAGIFRMTGNAQFIADCTDFNIWIYDDDYAPAGEVDPNVIRVDSSLMPTGYKALSAKGDSKFAMSIVSVDTPADKILAGTGIGGKLELKQGQPVYTAELSPDSIQYYKDDTMEPNITVDKVYDGQRTPLYETADYTVTFKNNDKPGTASAIIKGIGEHKFTIIKTFEIVCYHGRMDSDCVCQECGMRIVAEVHIEPLSTAPGDEPVPSHKSFENFEDAWEYACSLGKGYRAYLEVYTGADIGNTVLEVPSDSNILLRTRAIQSMPDKEPNPDEEPMPGEDMEPSAVEPVTITGSGEHTIKVLGSLTLCDINIGNTNGNAILVEASTNEEREYALFMGEGRTTTVEGLNVVSGIVTIKPLGEVVVNNHITVTDGRIIDLLAEDYRNDYTFKYVTAEGENSSWPTADKLEGKTISGNLTVAKKPISIQYSGKTQYTYDKDANADELSVELSLLDTNNYSDDDVKTQWYKIVSEGGEPEPIEGATTASYTPDTATEGTTVYYFEATCDGYTVRSPEFTVEVAEMFTVSVTSEGTNGEQSVVRVWGGANNLKKGDMVTVGVDTRDVYKFLGWYVKGEDSPRSYDREYTFRVESDIELIAKVEAYGNATVTIIGENSAQFIVHTAIQEDEPQEAPSPVNTYNKEYPIGTRLIIEAADPDKVSGWYNGSNKLIGTDRGIDIIVTGNTTIILRYTETENQSMVEFVSDYCQVLSYKAYSTADNIVPPTGPSKLGYTFRGWSVTNDNVIKEWSVVEAEIKEKIESGEKHITVRPVYEATGTNCTVTVEYPAGTLPNDTYTGTQGSGLTVTAKDIEGKVFSHWSSDKEGQNILSYEQEYYIRLTRNVTLYAHYKAPGEETEIKPVIAITDMFASIVDGKKKISFVATRSGVREEDYILCEHGVLFGTDASLAQEESFVLGGANVRKAQGTSTSTFGTYTLNFSVGNNTSLTVYARGYMVLLDMQTGNIDTYYSEISSGSYETLKSTEPVEGGNN